MAQKKPLPWRSFVIAFVDPVEDLIEANYGVASFSPYLFRAVLISSPTTIQSDFIA